MPVTSTSEKPLLPTELVYVPKELRNRHRFRQLKHFQTIGDANGRTNDCDTEFFSSSDYDGCTDNNDVFASYNNGNGGGGKILRISRVRRKRRDHMRYQPYDFVENKSNHQNNLLNMFIPNANIRIRNVLDRVQCELSNLRSEYISFSFNTKYIPI